jgi:hypothetical protein
MGCLSSTSARGLLCAGFLVSGLVLAPTCDAALTAGVGADYYSGPGGQIVRDVLGTIGSTGTRADLTAAIARYDHSILGPGTSVSALGSFTVTPTVFIQSSVTRSVGSNDYRAWRLSMGPLFVLAQGRWLGLTVSRSQEANGPMTTGLTSELGVALSPRVSGSARASLAGVEGGGTNFLGAAGLFWTPARRVQLFGELSIGRDLIALPQGGGAVGALPGGAGTASGALGPEYASGPAFLTGVRFVIR